MYIGQTPLPRRTVCRAKRRPVAIASDRTVYVLVLRVTSHAARLDGP